MLPFLIDRVPTDRAAQICAGPAPQRENRGTLGVPSLESKSGVKKCQFVEPGTKHLETRLSGTYSQATVVRTSLKNIRP